MLPKNPTSRDYQDYYETLTPEQQKQFRKAGLLGIINVFYTDKAEELQEDDEPVQGAIASGVFIDKTSSGIEKRFSFKLTETAGNYTLGYSPIQNKQ